VSVCDFCLSVCLSVCLLVWMSVNTITPEHGIILWSKRKQSSKMAVLVCNVGAAWRMTVKESTHAITERCAGGKETCLRVTVVINALKYDTVTVLPLIISHPRV